MEVRKRFDKQEEKMQYKANRVLSFAMSAAMMLTNIVSPVKAFAEEAPEAMTDAFVNEVQDPDISEEPQTEAKEYTIRLPYYEDIAYNKYML